MNEAVSGLARDEAAVDQEEEHGGSANERRARPIFRMLQIDFKLEPHEAHGFDEQRFKVFGMPMTAIMRETTVPKSRHRS